MKHVMLRPELLPIINRQWAKKMPSKTMNLHNPQGFCERIQWLKLFDEDRGQRDWCDKLTARDMVASMGMADILVPIAGIDDNHCVAKPNHRSGRAIICHNQAEKSRAIEKLSPTLDHEYGTDKGEWGYAGIKPVIYFEKLLPENTDYKFHCVNGKPVLIQIITNRQTGASETFYDMALNRVEINITRKQKQGSDPLPYGGDEIKHMLPIVRHLSQNWRYVRVDLYYSDCRVYFGELTFWPMAGFCRPEADEKLGKIIAW